MENNEERTDKRGCPGYGADAREKTVARAQEGNRLERGEETMVREKRRRELIAARVQVRIAIDAVQEAKNGLINARLMPALVETLEDTRRELLQDEMAVRFALDGPQAVRA